MPQSPMRMTHRPWHSYSITRSSLLVEALLESRLLLNLVGTRSSSSYVAESLIWPSLILLKSIIIRYDLAHTDPRQFSLLNDMSSLLPFLSNLFSTLYIVTRVRSPALFSNSIDMLCQKARLDARRIWSFRAQQLPEAGSFGHPFWNQALQYGCINLQTGSEYYRDIRWSKDSLRLSRRGTRTQDRF